MWSGVGVLCVVIGILFDVFWLFGFGIGGFIVWCLGCGNWVWFWYVWIVVGL